MGLTERARDKLRFWRQKENDSNVLRASSAESSTCVRPVPSRSSVGSLCPRQEPPPASSLWDRAYDTLKEKDPQLVDMYEKILFEEEQTSYAASDGVFPGPSDKNRRAQLKTVIDHGLQRLDDAKTKLSIADHEVVLVDQIANAAELALWAKDWIGSAAEASPEASIAWSGVCLILQLLTNPKSADDTRRDGIPDVTARMDYYVALEPLLGRLGANPTVPRELVSVSENCLVDLYQKIVEFQVRCVLRFYQGRWRAYLHDIIPLTDWKKMISDIKQQEDTVNRRLMQINELTARHELEILNEKSTKTLRTLKQSLLIHEQQLDVLREQLTVQRDLFQHTLSIEEQKRRQKCIQLFYLPDKTSATYDWYKGSVADHVEGTCQWILRHDSFKKWLIQKSGPLLVSADPGCGKSVLAKHLVDNVLPREQNTVCYFFFKYNDQNTATQALCALLHQLFSKNPFLVEHAMDSYEIKGSQLIQSEESLWTILDHVVCDPRSGPIIIVLDALDEYKESDLKHFIANVNHQIYKDQSAHAKLKFLFTCRPYEQVLGEFCDLLESFPFIRIPGEDESSLISQEIIHVIKYRIRKMMEKGLPAELASTMQTELLRIEHRTYLWVYLVFDHIEHGYKKTKRGVEKAIQTLPTSVNEAYQLILERSGEPATVNKVLSIILAASRPLTVSEMNIAVNTDYDIQSVDDLDLEKDDDFQSRLRTLCGLFISVYNGKVYFLHQTAREFLVDASKTTAAVIGQQPALAAVSSERQWSHSITVGDAHTVLAEVCVLYLNSFNEHSGRSPAADDPPPFFAGMLPAFGDEPYLSFADDLLPPSADNPLHVFSDYAARNWTLHFGKGTIAKDARIMPFALKICTLHSTSHAAWYKTFEDDRKPLKEDHCVGLLAASYFGLYSMVQRMLDDGANVHGDGEIDDETPIHAAARNGHMAILQLLLQKGADVNSTGKSELPLSVADSQGHDAVVRFLLDNGADVNATAPYGTYVLIAAGQRGDEAMARMLLEHGAEINATDQQGCSALFCAAKNGREAVVRFLLGKNANANTQDQNGWSPLLAAISSAIAGLTFKNVLAYNDPTSDLYRTVIDSNYDAIVRLLLESGANVNAADQDDRSPLFVAAGGPDKSLIKLLLEWGARVNATNIEGWSPIFMAVNTRHAAIVQVLLENEAAVNARCNDGLSPLIVAVRKEDRVTVQLLLEYGADVAVEDNKGRSALSIATQRGLREIAALLTQYEKDPDRRVV